MWQKLVNPSINIPLQRDKRDIRALNLFKLYKKGIKADIGFLGIPFDSAIPGFPGARFGPDAVRQALKYFSSYDIARDIDLSKIMIADIGNVKVVSSNWKETHKRVQKVVSGICKEGLFPLIIGGDHSLTAPSFAGIADTFNKKLGIIAFDAHTDVREYDQKTRTSGTPFRACLEENFLSGENLVQIGLRPFSNSPYYHNWTREMKFTLFTVKDIYSMGIEKVVDEALKIAGQGTEGIYLSIDIDCLDQAFAPGASNVLPGGMDIWSLLEGVFIAMKESKVVAMDLMEISPMRDVIDLTSRVGASIVLHACAGWSVRTASG